MASDAQANIILRLKDEFSRGLQQAGKEFGSFAQSVDRAGTAIARAGMKMVAIGTTMNAPFFAAAAAMKDYSFAASNEMIRLNNEVLSLSKTLSEAAMPTIRAFNDNFSRLVNTLKNVDPVLLQNIAHWAMVVGQILIVSGTIEIFVGKTLSLFGKLLIPIANVGKAIAGILVAANPVFLAIAVALVTIITLTDKWGLAFRVVLDSLEFVAATIMNAFSMLNSMLLKTIEIFVRVASLNLPGPAKKMADEIKAAADSSWKDSQKMALAMQNIITGKGGASSNGIASTIASIKASVKSIKDAWNSAGNEIETVMKDAGLRIKELGYQMSDGFASAFDQMLFEGKSFADSLTSIFKQMGRDILKDFMSTVGKNLINSVLGVSGTQSGSGIGGLLGAGLGSVFGPIGTAIGGLFGGALKFHEGGPIYAHNGLAPDEVPIIAQTGEGVLSRRGMGAIGGSGNLRKLNSGQSSGGGQTIVINQVIQAWDATDVYRNRKILSQSIEEEIKNNGNMRRTINNYR